MCFRPEQDISGQRPLPQNIQLVSAKAPGQRAGGLRSSQPSCWLLSGIVTAGITSHGSKAVYALLHDTMRFAVTAIVEQGDSLYYWRAVQCWRRIDRFSKYKVVKPARAQTKLCLCRWNELLLKRHLKPHRWLVRLFSLFCLQGMNFIVGYLLIITRDEEKSFWLLEALLGRILPGDPAAHLVIFVLNL